MTRTGNYKCVPVTVRGQAFPSIKDCARQLGYSRGHLMRLLRTQGHLDTLGLEENRRRERLAKPVRIGGLQFRTIADAARWLQISSTACGAPWQATPAQRRWCCGRR